MENEKVVFIFVNKRKDDVIRQEEGIYIYIYIWREIDELIERKRERERESKNNRAGERIW